LESFLDREYEAGFVTDIETVSLPPGLSEDTIRQLSAKKGEPEFLLEWRLNAYRQWLQMKPPAWAHLKIDPIDFQDIVYYSAPKSKKNGPKSLDEVDPELLRTYEKLGVHLCERARLVGDAVDAVLHSVTVATTFRKNLAQSGVIFCSFSEAVKDYPDLVLQYLGTVLHPADNFYAALNSAL